MLIFKSERAVAEELIPSIHMDSTFAELIGHSLDIFNGNLFFHFPQSIIEMGEAILKLKRNMERGFGIFALLNIGAAFHNILPQFVQVLKVNYTKIYFPSKPRATTNKFPSKEMILQN